MQEVRLVLYAIGIVIRVLVLLFLIGLLLWLWPLPDPFTQGAFALLVVVAVFSFRPARRRVLRWVAGTRPVAQVDTSALPK